MELPASTAALFARAMGFTGVRVTRAPVALSVTRFIERNISCTLATALI